MHAGIYRMCSSFKVCVPTLLFLFTGVVGVHAGESDIFLLLLHLLPVTSLSLYVEAHHQLVDHDTNDGADKWSNNWYQEPTIPSPKKLEKYYVNNKKDGGTRGDRDGKQVSEKSICTYVKTSMPHPAIAVKIRGPRSLAGLTA